MIINAVPVLPANNIQETILFYRDKLNFSVTEYPGYLVTNSGTVEIHFVKQTDNATIAPGTCLIWVKDVEDTYLRLAATDLIDLNGQLHPTAWGTKEFILQDNSGNILRFAQAENYGTVNKYSEYLSR